MDENNRTDREVLTKGVKLLGICLILMFIGPSLLYVAFSNKEKPLYIFILIFAIILCITAIVILFVAINTILNSIFKKKK